MSISPQNLIELNCDDKLLIHTLLIDTSDAEDALNIIDVRFWNRYCKSDLATSEQTSMQPGVGVQHETELHVDAEPVIAQV